MYIDRKADKQMHEKKKYIYVNSWAFQKKWFKQRELYEGKAHILEGFK